MVEAMAVAKTSVITSYSIHYTKLYDNETKEMRFVMIHCGICPGNGLFYQLGSRGLQDAHITIVSEKSKIQKC